jgi:uncharacterized protein (DUF697 family)
VGFFPIAGLLPLKIQITMMPVISEIYDFVKTKSLGPEINQSGLHKRG